MAPSVEKLSYYLRTRAKTGSMVLSTLDDETEEIDESLPWKGQDFPQNGETCLVVLYYVMKFLPNYDDHQDGTLTDTVTDLDDLASRTEQLEQLLSYSRPSSDHHGILTDTITRLDDLASLLGLSNSFLFEEVLNYERKPETEQEIGEIYVNSFIPQVQKYFRVPKLQELSDKDKSLKENEILAGFLDFLLQILNAEAHMYSDKEMFAPLQKELRFVLTFLGDIPFQCTQLQLVKNILAEFEILSNEIGTFIYSCFFATHPIKAVMFYGGRDSLLGLFGLFNEKIKQHCSKFSEIPRDITTQANVVDSLFIVDSLIEDLENVINCRFDLPIDSIKDQIKTIHEEMMFSRTFLKDVELAHDTYKDESKESSIQIRDVAYEAEYLLNSYIVGNVPIWYLNLRLPIVIQNIKIIGLRLREIKKTLDMKVLQVKKDFNQKLSFKATKTSVDVAVNDNVVVGFEDEKLKILDALTAGSKTRQIISIFGMPGLGKTTMAKKLYDNRLCCDYFDKRAWFVVSQTYHKRNLLIGIFMSLETSKLDKEEIFQMEDNNLALEIHRSLKGQRYLIVLDDVWHSNVWDDLKRFFPNDANGSRIILTSRIKDISPTDSIFFPLPLLSDVQCWDLLEKRVFFEEPCPPELLCIGKEIAAKCHGLPLATVVIAGILVKLEKEEKAWKKVESNLDSYMLDNSSGCLKILDLSYEYLPDHIKRCFLYLAAFREDEDIRTRKLIWMWVVEGFIPKHDTKSPENVAEGYLYDLINRSLVMIAKRRFDGGVKSCGIHDLLHDMCLRKAHEENFLKAVKQEFSIYEKHQRLCVHPTPNSLRSFGLHCRSFSGKISDSTPGFSHMPLIRVINQQLDQDDMSSVSKEIYLLANLRYLSVGGLPHPIADNLVNLEILCSFYEMKLMLSSILKMVKLRHINCTLDLVRIEKDCDTNQTTNLESLGGVCIYSHDDEELLRLSPFLRRLKCFCDGALFPDLHSLTQLESLRINFFNRFDCKLTEIYFPSTIKKLTLFAMGLPWEEMSTIGILPNLQCLKLESYAFVGEVWETRDGEFQQLRFLALRQLHLEQWISWSEHFPKLECLVLEWCRELQEIPDDLGNISTLQTIEVIDCSEEASKSAVGIEKEQHELGNEELKVIIKTSEWSKDQFVRESEEDNRRNQTSSSFVSVTAQQQATLIAGEVGC